MKIIKKISEIKKIINEEKKSDKKVAFVPTMGALHLGHLTLIKEAKKKADIVVVSIFVNKAQFNDKSDYEKYPRNIENDVKKLEGEGVDYIFYPDENEIYPEEISCKIIVENLASCLCGSARKGHFDGVALIITKLFNIINPDFAFFGKKDYQQFLIIKKLTKDFNFSTKIIGVETVREKSGLAMSSRNQRLDEQQKNIAANIFRILNEIKNEVKNSGNVENILQNKKVELLKIGFEKIDYLEMRDEDNLELLQNLQTQKNYRIFIAIYLNNVRLIDNLKI